MRTTITGVTAVIVFLLYVAVATQEDIENACTLKASQSIEAFHTCLSKSRNKRSTFYDNRRFRDPRQRRIGEGRPCTSYVRINDPRRSVSYTIPFLTGDAAKSADALCDRALKRRWYRFDGPAGGNMPEVCPAEFSCGTHAPIWLNGEHPTRRGEVVTREVCVSLRDVCCTRRWDIQVANCGDFYTYQLIDTPGCFMAYCAGERVKCPPGSSSPSGFGPTCTANYPKLSGRATLSQSLASNKVLFHCDYEGRLPPGTNLDAQWFLQGDPTDEERKDEIPVYQEYLGSKTRTTLEEDKWMGYMGYSIFCRFIAKSRDGIASPPVESEKFFAGIKILNRVIEVSESSRAAQLQLQSTVPIRCLPQFGDTCSIDISLAYEADHNGKTCHGDKIEQIVFGDCNVKLTPQNWNQVHNISVKAVRDFYHDGNKAMLVDFKPVYSTATSRIWHDYKLPKVEVLAKDVRTKMCSSTGDPHYLTFDERYYHMYLEGEFVLYKSTKFPIQVNTRVQKCGRSQGIEVTCNCAIAVMVEDDAIIIDRCKKVTKKLALGERFPDGFETLSRYALQQGESFVDGLRLIEHDQGRKYTVNLPTGGFIEFEIGKRWINVYIHAASDDFNATMGLCGTFDDIMDNDLTYSDGRRVARVPEGAGCGDNKEVCDFANSYRVTEEDTLFGPLITKKLPEYEFFQKNRYCKCIKQENGESQVECNYNFDVTNCNNEISTGVDKTDQIKIHSQTVVKKLKEGNTIEKQDKRKWDRFGNLVRDQNGNPIPEADEKTRMFEERERQEIERKRQDSARRNNQENARRNRQEIETNNREDNERRNRQEIDTRRRQEVDARNREEVDTRNREEVEARKMERQKLMEERESQRKQFMREREAIIAQREKERREREEEWRRQQEARRHLSKQNEKRRRKLDKTQRTDDTGNQGQPSIRRSHGHEDQTTKKHGDMEHEMARARESIVGQLAEESMTDLFFPEDFITDDIQEPFPHHIRHETHHRDQLGPHPENRDQIHGFVPQGNPGQNIQIQPGHHSHSSNRHRTQSGNNDHGAGFNPRENPEHIIPIQPGIHSLSNRHGATRNINNDHIHGFNPNGNSKPNIPHQPGLHQPTNHRQRAPSQSHSHSKIKPGQSALHEESNIQDQSDTHEEAPVTLKNDILRERFFSKRRNAMDAVINNHNTRNHSVVVDNEIHMIPDQPTPWFEDITDEQLDYFMMDFMADEGFVGQEPEWPTPSGMTEMKAKRYCIDYILRSKVGRTCNKVVADKLESIVASCTTDIKVTDDVEWAVASLGSLITECTEEIHTNASFWVPKDVMLGDEAPPPPVAQKLLQNICPNDCSKQGSCVSGVCECRTGYSGRDCSVKTWLGPQVNFLQDGGMCDIRRKLCRYIGVYGEGFREDAQINCKFQEFDTYIHHTVTTPAKFETFEHVICELPVHQVSEGVPDTEVHYPFRQYTLTVIQANIPATPMPVVVYDSLCQDCLPDEETFFCYHKSGTCEVSGVCFAAGDRHPTDCCLKCDPDQSTSRLVKFEEASLFEIKPSEGAYSVTQGDSWEIDISADGPYGCTATYDVAQPSSGLRVQRSTDGIHVELDTQELGSYELGVLARDPCGGVTTKKYAFYVNPPDGGYHLPLHPPFTPECYSNLPPVFSPDHNLNLLSTLNELLKVQFEAYDPEGGLLHFYVLKAQVASTFLSITDDGLFRYVSPLHQGTDILIIFVVDSCGHKTEMPITITSRPCPCPEGICVPDERYRRGDGFYQCECRTERGQDYSCSMPYVQLAP